ncbi:MAG: hypothetical protein Q8Q52_05510 [Acidimicrobiia bacterium]|jgi:hypothetical protein|nr:hypothetical protein [Acidimicrobiia bacterium]
MPQLFIDPEIGPPTYSFLSGITHGLPASLAPFFVASGNGNDPLAVWEQRRATLHARTANLVAGLIVMGVIPVLENRHRYLGVTPSPETQRMGRHAISLVEILFS